MLREALMAADQCANIHLDTSSSNGWMKYYPGLTLEEVFRQALAVAGPIANSFRHRLVVFPAGLAEAGVCRAGWRASRRSGVGDEDRQKISVAISSDCFR